MPISLAAGPSDQDNVALNGDADLLPRHPVFRARDLEPAREYLSGVLAPHRLAYLTREHRLNFRHRRAKLGAVELNALQFGGDVMVIAPHIPDYFLLQFTLAGSCTLAQGGRTYDMRAGSVAVINPCRPFTKSWSPDGRQLLIRIDRSLLEREMLAWTGRDPREPIEFDQSQAFAMEKVATLTHAVRMLCDDLRGESSGLDHPLVRDRVASTLASALLVGLPHNHSGAFDGAAPSIAPASVRRAERFIEDNALWVFKSRSRLSVVRPSRTARSAGTIFRYSCLRARRQFCSGTTVRPRLNTRALSDVDHVARSTKLRSQGSNRNGRTIGLCKPQRRSLIPPIEGQTGVGHQLVGGETGGLLSRQDRGDNIRGEESQSDKARCIRRLRSFPRARYPRGVGSSARTFAWRFSDRAREDGSKSYPLARNSRRRRR